MKTLIRSILVLVMIIHQAQSIGAEAVVPNYVLESFRPSYTSVDPIREARVVALAKKTFPNLSSQMAASELLSRTVDNPSMRGNLRGRLAEEVFSKLHREEGWKPVASKIAPENDFYRRLPSGDLEGAQIKVHAKVDDYFRSMVKDSKAERFVVPDDHYEQLKRELEIRRQGALRGGDVAKADYYEHQSKRLMKLGRNFAELDGAILSTAKHYRAIATATAQAGKQLPFIGIALAIADGTIKTYEFASGKTDVSEYLKSISKVAIGGLGSWYAATTASQIMVAAGATGIVPLGVVVVVAGGTYLVVDWAIDYTEKSVSSISLSGKDLELIWPKGLNHPEVLRQR